MRYDPQTLPDDVLKFLCERHLATLTTARADGSQHVVPVGFTWDDESRVARIITSGTSHKVRHAERGGRAAVCQVDGRRWLTLEGAVRVLAHPAAVQDAVQRYAARYRRPRENTQRVVLEIQVDRIMGSL